MAEKTTPKNARKKIFEAALKLFSENGFHATTTRVIAQFAGVNEVTLFRLYKSKQQLFNDILDHVKSVGFDSRRLDGLNLSPKESIRFVIDNFMETMEEHPKEFRLMFHAVMDEVEGYETEFIGNHQTKMLSFLENAFQALEKQTGIVFKNPPRIHAHMMISTMLGLSTGRILTHTLPIKKFTRQEICTYIANLYMGDAE